MPKVWGCGVSNGAEKFQPTDDSDTLVLLATCRVRSARSQDHVRSDISPENRRDSLPTVSLKRWVYSSSLCPRFGASGCQRDGKQTLSHFSRNAKGEQPVSPLSCERWLIRNSFPVAFSTALLLLGTSSFSDGGYTYIPVSVRLVWNFVSIWAGYHESKRERRRCLNSSQMVLLSLLPSSPSPSCGPVVTARKRNTPGSFIVPSLCWFGYKYEYFGFGLTRTQRTP